MPRLENMDKEVGSDELSSHKKGERQKLQDHMNYGYNYLLKAPPSYYPYEPSVQEVYVNVKQFEAIKKRKARRDYLDSLMEIQRSSYLHESRHRHAMNRLRAPSGRFLTKKEMAEIKIKKHNEDNAL